MKVVNSMIFELLDRVVEEATFLTNSEEKATLTSREIQTSVRLTLPGELAKHAVAEGTKAVTKYSMNKGGSKSARAGLVFPVSFLMSFTKQKSRLRVGQGAPVYLTAVSEYMTAELLELAGNAARDNKLSRITPRHIMLAIRGDEELDKFFRGYVAYGGVVPHIHMAVLGKATGASMAPAVQEVKKEKEAFGGGGPIKKIFGAGNGFGGTGPFGGMATFGGAKPAFGGMPQKKVPLKKSAKEASDDDEDDDDEDDGDK